jgi:hypothetical protein
MPMFMFIICCGKEEHKYRRYRCIAAHKVYTKQHQNIYILLELNIFFFMIKLKKLTMQRLRYSHTNFDPCQLFVYFLS